MSASAGPELRRLLTLAGVLLLVAAVATGGGAWALLPEPEGSSPVGASVAIAVIVFATGLSVILGAILRAADRLTTGIIVEMGLAQGVAAILLLGSLVPRDLTGALAGYAAGSVLACLLGLVAVHRHFTPSTRGRVDESRRAPLVTLLSMMSTAVLVLRPPLGTSHRHRRAGHTRGGGVLRGRASAGDLHGHRAQHPGDLPGARHGRAVPSRRRRRPLRAGGACGADGRPCLRWCCSFR